MKNLVIAVLLCSGVLVSCAQKQIQPSMQQVPISSEPLGAEVYVDGKMIGTTPTSVRVERSRDHIITFVRKGYKTKNIQIQSLENHEKLFSDAILSGFETSSQTDDLASGIRAARKTVQDSKVTGQYNDLHPGSISVVLEKK